MSGRYSVGGIAGETYFENVVDSQNSGTVQGESSVGGVVGNGSALNSLNSGAVIGSGDGVGGAGVAETSFVASSTFVMKLAIT